jgi:hypothetical protein
MVINFFGGPGVGKSTAASYIFSQLKARGIHCEYVTEFAKDLVWEGNTNAFDCQMYISGNQAWRIRRVIDKVPIVITDSPICIGILYNHDNDELNDALLSEFNKYENLNFYLNREKVYVTTGRNQTESEANEIDILTKKLLEDNNITYITENGDSEGYMRILDTITNLIQYK